MSLPRLSEVSRSTIWSMDEPDLAAAHSALHDLWELGSHSEILATVHHWIVQELASRGLAHPWKSELDDDEETFDEPFEEPWKDAPWAFVKALAPPEGVPAWLADIAADPIDGGWDPATGTFAWFDEAACGMDVAKSLEGGTAEDRATRQIVWAAEADAVQSMRAAGLGGPALDALAVGLGVPGDPVRLIVEKAVWSAAFVNRLPDSAFLHIGTGGAKDADGRTTPRSLRKFPVRDKTGKVDAPHLRNALSRIPQSDLSAADKARAKVKARKLAKAAGIFVFKALVPAERPVPGAAGDPLGGRTIVFVDAIEKRMGGKVEQRIATGPVIVPGVVDGHGDVFTVDAVDKAQGSFMENYGPGGTRLGLQHSCFPDGIRLHESWILKQAWDVGGRTFPEGTWMMSVRVDEPRWDDIKAGRIRGFSPGGAGKGRWLAHDMAAAA